jgi:hypothetical protein
MCTQLDGNKAPTEKFAELLTIPRSTKNGAPMQPDQCRNFLHISQIVFAEFFISSENLRNLRDSVEVLYVTELDLNKSKKKTTLLLYSSLYGNISVVDTLSKGPCHQIRI